MLLPFPFDLEGAEESDGASDGMDEKDGMAETDGASVLDFLPLPLPLPAMTPVGEEESKRTATNAEVKNVDLTMVELFVVDVIRMRRMLDL